jgi:hypothetical protein
MDEERLRAIERRAEAAPSGVWSVDCQTRRELGVWRMDVWIGIVPSSPGFPGEALTAFLENARQDVRELCVEVRRLRESATVVSRVASRR